MKPISLTWRVLPTFLSAPMDVLLLWTEGPAFSRCWCFGCTSPWDCILRLDMNLERKIIIDDHFILELNLNFVFVRVLFPSFSSFPFSTIMKFSAPNYLLPAALIMTFYDYDPQKITLKFYMQTYRNMKYMYPRNYYVYMNRIFKLRKAQSKTVVFAIYRNCADPDHASGIVLIQ